MSHDSVSANSEQATLEELQGMVRDTITSLLYAAPEMQHGFLARLAAEVPWPQHPNPFTGQKS